MEIKIKWATNGWIVEEIIGESILNPNLQDLQEEDMIKTSRYVEDSKITLFSHKHDDKEEVEAFCDFLHYINELIGPTHSRSDKYSVKINVEPGDKYDGDDFDWENREYLEKI